MAEATFVFYIDWDNDGSVDALTPEAGEDVTARVLGVRTPLNWKIGRDGGRSLSGFLSGDITLELNNTSRDYSPDNATSPLFGNLGPGKPVRIRATSGTTRDIYRGFIDTYEIDPFREKKSVTISCVDAFAHISEAIINTSLFKGERTGEAIGEVLDAIGWPAGDRDIDPGCTVIRHWWLENETAGTAIKDILESEGPPAVCYVDGAANFVFRDRAHRLLDAASTSSQATFRDTGSEPLFSPPVTYDVGFRDIVNSVSFDVEERTKLAKDVVWSSDDTYRVAASSSITLNVQAQDPFNSATTPVSGTDYTVLAGSVSSVVLSRTSGQSTEITINAGASGATIEKLQLRANSHPVTQNYRITVEDSASIAKYGRKSWTEGVPKWCGRNDADAIANIILLLRKERLPVFTFTVNNANSTRLGHILDRDISDRIIIVETETSTNDDHYIESAEYTVDEVGKFHTAQFACERKPTWAPDETNIFILDSNVSGHRLDSGKLGY